jgi:hypothetical protein
MFDINLVDDLQIGEAGEHLVCADLILSGFHAFQSAQGLPFDVVCIVGNMPMRIQVKTTRRERSVPQRKRYTPAYLFHTRRCGKGGRRAYDDRDFDVLALVALDIREVAYLLLDDTKQTIHLNREKFRTLTFGSVLERLETDSRFKA